MSSIQHVTIPNSTLRRFLNEQNEIYFLDLDTREIKLIDVDTYGETPRVMYNTTREDVFSRKADEYIRLEAENKLGEAYKDIDNLVNCDKGKFKMPTNKEGIDEERFEKINQRYKEITIKTVAIQIARTPYFRKLIGIEDTTMKKDVFEKIVDKYKNMLKSLQFNIAVIHKNNTDSTFVLTPSHCIMYGDSIENIIIFVVLSPYYALTLMSDNNYRRCIIDDIHNCINLKYDISINSVNYSAFLEAQHHTSKHLIGYKNQLEFIRNKELK